MNKEKKGLKKKKKRIKEEKELWLSPQCWIVLLILSVVAQCHPSCGVDLIIYSLEKPSQFTTTNFRTVNVEVSRNRNSKAARLI